jgi:hypothetical protein
LKVRTALFSAALGLGALSLPIAALPAGTATASTAAHVSSSPVQVHGDLHLAKGVHIPTTHLPSPKQIGNGTNGSKLYDSNNWSGYAAVGNKGVKLTAVGAEFTVPSVNCAASSPGTFGAWTSEWVGLDGFSNSSVEQEGVSAECTSTTAAPTYYAWYEMYPDATEAYTGAINPGDAIIVGTGKYKTGNNFQLTVTDVTSDSGFSTEQACPSGSTCPAASAEVIMEAPYEDGILPLADYGIINFAASQVAINFKAKANFSGSSSSYQLAQINMVSSSDAPESTTGGFYGGSAFSTTWVSS